MRGRLPRRALAALAFVLSLAACGSRSDLGVAGPVPDASSVVPEGAAADAPGTEETWVLPDATRVTQDDSAVPWLHVTCPASASSLPGVSIGFPLQSTKFALSDVARGVSFLYEVAVKDDVAGVLPDAQGECASPGPSGLLFHEVISGNYQQYCDCDQGRCASDATQTTVPKGVYARTVTWDGKNWNGPSDTGLPEGAPFPPGQYVLTVTAKGTVGGAPFEVSASLCFVLVTDIFDAGPKPCGWTSCLPEQVCVETECCPSCNPLPEGGVCPQGTTLGMCSIGGFPACLGACTAPPARCATILCSADATCACLVQAACGSGGGSCDTLGEVVRCGGCF